METASTCSCPKVDLRFKISKEKRPLDFLKLEKEIGPGNLNWFDDLTSRAEEKRIQNGETSTPLLLGGHMNLNSPAVLVQPPELLQVSGCLTPLSEWALLSSNDHATSTPAALAHLIVGSSPTLSSTPVGVESCLKTCKGISERLGLPVDDTNISWTNSMATPCQERQLVPSQQYSSSPIAKPKGFPRALFSPDPGTSDSEDLVQELNLTADDERQTCGSSAGQSSGTPVCLRKTLMRDRHLRSSSQQSVGESSLGQSGQTRRDGGESPCRGSTAGRESPAGAQGNCRSKERRPRGKRRRGGLHLSPLIVDHSREVSGMEEMCPAERTPTGALGSLEEDVKLKMNILRRAVGYASQETDQKHISKSAAMDTENVGSADLKFSNKTEPNPLKSPLLSRKRKHLVLPNDLQSSDENGPLSVVSQVLSDFIESPASLQCRRKRAPKVRGQKRKAYEALLPEDYKEDMSMCTPLNGSQTLRPQSILSSRKSKTGSSRKRVRFAEELCQREGEERVVAKKLEYVDSSEISSERSTKSQSMVSASDKSLANKSNSNYDYVQMAYPVSELSSGEQCLFDSQSDEASESVQDKEKKEMEATFTKNGSSSDDTNQNLQTGKPVNVKMEDRRDQEKVETGKDSCESICVGSSDLQTSQIKEENSSVKTEHSAIVLDVKGEKDMNRNTADQKSELTRNVASMTNAPACIQLSENTQLLSNGSLQLDQEKSEPIHASDPQQDDQPQDELFSQVSPSSLSKMCVIADSDEITQERSQQNSSGQAANAEKNCNNCSQTLELSVTRAKDSICDEKKIVISDVKPKLKHNSQDDGSTSTKSNSLQSDKDKISVSSDQVQNVSNSNMSNNSEAPTSLFKTKSKKRGFFYPTSSQIKAVCPQTVFDFRTLTADTKPATTESAIEGIDVSDGKERETEETDSVKDTVLKEDKCLESSSFAKDVPADLRMKPKSQSYNMGFTKFSELFDDSMDEGELCITTHEETSSELCSDSLVVKSDSKISGRVDGSVTNTSSTNDSLKRKSAITQGSAERSSIKFPSAENLQEAEVVTAGNHQKSLEYPLGSQYVRTMVSDVQDELFCDIEFSQVGENQSQAVGAKDKLHVNNNNSTDVHSSLLEEDDGEITFKKPEVPERVKHQTLSDSDTDILLSDVDLSLASPKDKHKVWQDSSNVLPKSEVNAGLCTSKTAESKTMKVAYSSLSETDTDLYVASTEEIKDLSSDMALDGNIVPARTKLSKKSKLWRKESVLLARSLVLSDSDSDVGGPFSRRVGEDVPKEKDRLVETPKVVEETHPDLAWSDLETEKLDLDSVVDHDQDKTDMSVLEKPQGSGGFIICDVLGTRTPLDSGGQSQDTSVKEDEMSATRPPFVIVDDEIQIRTAKSGEHTFVENDLLLHQTRNFTIEIKEIHMSEATEQSSLQHFEMKNLAPVNLCGSESGFSTAGGRKLDLDGHSLHKAQNLFHDLGSAVTLTSNLCPKDSRSDEINSAKTKNTAVRKSDSIKLPSVDEVSGFSTASGKTYSLNINARQKSTSIMDVEADKTMANSKIKPVTQSKKPDFSRRKKTYINVADVIAGCSEASMKSSFSSFSTASGKAVNLNDEALKKAQTLMDSVDKQETPVDKVNLNHSASEEESQNMIRKDDDLEAMLAGMLKTKSEGFQKKVDMLDLQPSQPSASDKDLLPEKSDSKEERFDVTARKGLPCKDGKQNPMLKPKGFRPFKKPRLIQKTKGQGSLHLLESMDLASKEEPDMNELMLEEFSHDMTQASQLSDHTSKKIYEPPKQRSSHNEKRLNESDGNESNNSEISSSLIKNPNFAVVHAVDTQYGAEDSRMSDSFGHPLLEKLFEGDMSSQIDVTVKTKTDDAKGYYDAFQTASARSVSLSESEVHENDFVLSEDTSCKVQKLECTDHVVPCKNQSNSRTFFIDSGNLSASLSLFQTASGKGVSVSKAALENSRKLFDDSTNGTGSSLFQTTSEKDNSASKDTLDKSRRLLDESTDLNRSNLVQSPSENNISVSESDVTELDGFQTAGKDVFDSKYALVKSRKILEDSSYFSGSSGFQTASGKGVSVSKDAFEISRRLLEDSFDVAGSDHFEATSGKEVFMSKDALERSQKHLDKSFEATGSCLFQTASGKGVSVSKDALEKSRTLLDDSSDVAGSSLFQTASGKGVSVSKYALEKSRTLLDDSSEGQGSSLFQTASGKGVSVSKGPLEKSRTFLDNSSDVAGSGLFQTASGKGVSVSKSVLEKSRTFLDNSSDVAGSSLFQTASGKGVSVSKDALEKSRTLLDDCFDVAGSSLFQTASGKGVSVSKDALEKSRTLLDDSSDVAGSCLFQTASGKGVSVSKDALEKSRTLLDDSSEGQGSSLFQTASGNRVSVSKDALEKSRKLLDDSSEVAGSSLFQTASGKGVSVSKGALEKSRKLLDDSSDVTGSGLFQTASGKRVAVSKDALEKSQKMQDKSLEESGCSLFQTASGKGVSVSNDALRKSRKLLDGESLLQHQLTSGKETYETKPVLPSSGQRDSSSAVVPEVFGPDDIMKALWEKQHKLTPRQSSGRSDTRKPIVSTPEDLHWDRVGRRGSRIYPLKSTSLTGRPNLQEMDTQNDLLAVPTEDNKSSTSCPFKTPYKSPTTVGKTVCQEKRNPSESMTPKFYPRASVRSRMLSRSYDKGAQSRTEADEVKSKATLHADATTYDFDNRKDEVSDSQAVAAMMMVEEVESIQNKITPKPASSSDEINWRCQLNEARSRQRKMTDSKKKQKIRPVCGRLLQLKASCGRKLKFSELAVNTSYSAEQLLSFGVKPEAFNISSISASDFRFNLRHFYPDIMGGILLGDGAFLVPDDSGFAGKEEFHKALLTAEGVDQTLTCDLWTFNHYRWIVWKLAAYETGVPSQFGGRCLTPENVMLQLKYRYDLEIDQCQRSALKRIVERDDASCKRLILCVCGLQTNQHDSEKLLELTDGWYCIKAKLDVGLRDLVDRKHIVVGQKLCITGAELTGSQDACTPLEIPDNLSLKICTNSTRPADWDAKLGYQKDPRPLCVALGSLHAEGGLVGCIDGIVTRIYPLMFMEKLAEGGTVFRAEDAEERVQRQFERQKQDKMEKLYSQLQTEFDTDQGKSRRRSRKRWTCHEVEELHSGQEIFEAVEGSLYPEEVHSWLSPAQIHRLEDYRRSVQEKQQQQMRNKFQQAWADAQQGLTSRNITPVLKLRYAGCGKRDIDSRISTIVTVWRPTQEWTSLQEGKRYRMFSLTASHQKSRLESHSVHLTANRQTRLQPRPVDENYLDLVYEPREVWSVKHLRHRCPPNKEFDFVGIVISHQADKQRHSDMVYVADVDAGVLCIRFWSGLKSFGVEDVLKVGKCFVGTNLILKQLHGPGIVLADVSQEISRFSASAKSQVHRKSLCKITSLKSADRERLIERAESHLKETENKTTQSCVTTPEGLFSPMEDKAGPSGDNASTPNSLTKKQRSLLREKSAKLMLYGSPKPLSTLNCQVSPAATRAFKVPSNLTKNLHPT